MILVFTGSFGLRAIVVIGFWCKYCHILVHLRFFHSFLYPSFDIFLGGSVFFFFSCSSLAFDSHFERERGEEILSIKSVDSYKHIPKHPIIFIVGIIAFLLLYLEIFVGILFPRVDFFFHFISICEKEENIPCIELERGVVLYSFSFEVSSRF